MQIERKQPITDIESIEIVKKKLEKIYNTNKEEKKKEQILIKKYYKKDNKEILSIYQIIDKFNHQ